jgi:hypothetical protein
MFLRSGAGAPIPNRASNDRQLRMVERTATLRTQALGSGIRPTVTQRRQARA